MTKNTLIETINYKNHTIEIHLEVYPVDPVKMFGEEYVTEKEKQAYKDGEVFGFRVTQHGIDITTCWGFYDIKHCIEEAKGEVDYIADKEEKIDFDIKINYLPDLSYPMHYIQKYHKALMDMLDEENLKGFTNDSFEVNYGTMSKPYLRIDKGIVKYGMGIPKGDAVVIDLETGYPIRSFDSQKKARMFIIAMNSLVDWKNRKRYTYDESYPQRYRSPILTQKELSQMSMIINIINLQH